MPFIYALCDPDTDEVRYVGKSDDMQRRYKEHTNGQSSPNTYRKAWIQSLQKQGKQPVLRILEEVIGVDWREREQWWIIEMKSRGMRLTNLTDGGDGIDGYRHTPETRLLMSEKAKQRGLSQERLDQMHAAARLTTQSESFGQKTSKFHKGRKRSEETRKKQSAVRMGMKFSPDHVANMSRVRMGHPAHNKGVPATESIRRGVSLAQRKLTDDQVNEIRFLIDQGSMSQAAIARKFGVTPPFITRIKQGYTYYSEKEN